MKYQMYQLRNFSKVCFLVHLGLPVRDALMMMLLVMH